MACCRCWAGRQSWPPDAKSPRFAPAGDGVRAWWLLEPARRAVPSLSGLMMGLDCWAMPRCVAGVGHLI